MEKISNPKFSHLKGSQSKRAETMGYFTLLFL